MDCPKCNLAKYVKDGNINGKQGYLCKNCGRRYTVKKRSIEKLDKLKRMTLKLYLEGMSFRSIGRVLK